jgi:hypothetical protein
LSDLSAFIDPKFCDDLTALGPIKETRGGEGYKSMVSRLSSLQAVALRAGLECSDLLKITQPSKELKARLELMSAYRGDDAPAPSGLHLLSCYNEYASVLASCAEVDNVEFQQQSFVEREGKILIEGSDSSGDPPTGDSEEARQRKIGELVQRQRERRELEQQKRNLEQQLAHQGNPQADGLSGLKEEVASLRRKLATSQPVDPRGEPKVDRAANLAKVLDVSAGPLGLTGEQLTAMSSFISKPVSGGSEKDRDALSLLLPNTDASTSDSAAMAAELVRGALMGSAQNRRYANYDDFQRVMHIAIKKARGSDPALAIQLADHLRHVTTLAMSHPWKDAERYHWGVMTRVEDGLYDLSQGGDTWTLANMAFDSSREKPGAGGRTKKSGYTKETAKFCDYHGFGAHLTQDCKVKFKPGEKSKNFRSAP